MEKEEFGRRLASKRVALGISRKELTEKAGVSLSAVAAYERGEKLPPLEIAEKLADALQVSIDWLVGKLPETPQEERLLTWGDVLKVLGRLVVDVPNISIKSKDRYFRWNENHTNVSEVSSNEDDISFATMTYSIILPSCSVGVRDVTNLDGFPISAGSLLERIAPLLKTGAITREMFNVLINDYAQNNAFADGKLEDILPY